jgi:hypothetical protein
MAILILSTKYVQNTLRENGEREKKVKMCTAQQQADM